MTKPSAYSLIPRRDGIVFNYIVLREEHLKIHIEHAAFYGGTALRILYGLDRFSEDLDFSLLAPSDDFNLGRYTASLEEELMAFGFNVRVDNAPCVHEN